MAKQTLIDTTVLLGGSGEALDLSGFANAFQVDGSVEEIDVTTFNDLARRRIAGLEDASFSGTVLDEDAADPWQTLSDLHAAEVFAAWIESNASMAEGDRGIFLRALETTLSRGGTVGTAREMQVSGSGDARHVIARVLQQDESLTVTGNSTGIQFGALASGETLYCVCWCLSVDAGTIDVTIESDDNSGFTSASTRATFTQFTDRDTEQQTVAGPVTDDWWRVAYTIATGPAVIVVMIGKR